MAMVELATDLRRDAGKERNRKRLARGKVPGVIYGKKLETRMLEFERRELEKFLVTARRGTVVARLNIRDGAAAKEAYAVLKEAQSDPRTDRVIHVDFYEVAQGKKFRIEVPVRVRGKAAGIEQGGILEIVARSLEVLCTPDSVPEQIEIDVSGLEIGDALHLGDVAFPPGVSPVEKDRKMTIASVHAPRVEEVVTVAAEEAAEGAEGASVAESEEKGKEKE
ncbi:MAG: 50S ribosomal protein L25 [Deltaproteobacteria bacterium]|nr:50S ribosomal protein L25 [Deltaproteobacteria bacterium]